jgi:sigma-B regulation protein RsbU (phosphoserine phosphatase)
MPRVPRLRYFHNSLQELVRQLPFRALIPLAIAIFALFSVIGPVTDLLGGARQPLASVVRNSLLSGVLALGYAFGSMRRNWVAFALTAALQIAWISAGRHSDSALVAVSVPDRMKFDGLWVLGSMIVSYASFLWFIKGTATRYLRVRAEMELAHQIHQVLVPPIAVTYGEFEFAGISIPSGEVGGDLVDVVPLEPDAPQSNSNSDWFGYVADVSGHGVSSGVVMGMFKTGPLSSLLDDLNKVLLPLKSGSMFVTAACVRGGRTGGTLEFAVAGHLPILRVRTRASNPREVEEVTTPQIPIGMFGDYRFTSAALECDRGDLLALITDGLTEVFDARDEQFGMDAVKAILGRLADRPLAEISQQIVAAARAHGAQLDDQTLLLVRRL